MLRFYTKFFLEDFDRYYEKLHSYVKNYIETKPDMYDDEKLILNKRINNLKLVIFSLHCIFLINLTLSMMYYGLENNFINMFI